MRAARRIARLGVLGQRAVEDACSSGAVPATGRIEGLGRVVDDLVEDGGGAVPDERPLPAEELVEDHARREDVAAAVELLAPDLLRAHVVDGADHHPRLGDSGAAELGDAEVHDLGRAVLEQADVGGLDVAVHDAVLVREVQARAAPAP
jgi:hypothetical protein